MKSHTQDAGPSEHGHAHDAGGGIGLVGTLLLIGANLALAAFALTQHLAWRFGFDRALGPPALIPSAYVGERALLCIAVVGVGAGLGLLLYRRARRFSGMGFLAAGLAWVLSWGPVYAPYRGLVWLHRALEAPGYAWAANEATLVLGAAALLSMGGTAAPLLLKQERPSGSHGTAGWSGGDALKENKDGIVVGRDGHALLRYQGGGHLMTVAPTRSGKGVGAVIPNLLSYEGSVLVTDPKGENYAVTAGYRGRPREEGGLGQTIYALDPFEHMAGPTGKAAKQNGVPRRNEKRHGDSPAEQENHLTRFNPLDIIEPGSEDAGDDASMLAGMLIPIPPEVRDEHFYKEAQQFLAGLILYVAGTEEKGSKLRALPYVRELLMLPTRQERSTFDAEYFDRDYETEARMPRRAFALEGQAPEDVSDGEAPPEGLNRHGRPMTFGALLADMARRTDLFSGRVSSAANQLSQKASKERSGVISTAQQNTNFIETPRMKRALSGSDVDFSELKTGRASMYLILPAHRMDTYKSWLRLMISCAITATVRTPGKPKRQILFLLDEFANLGRMRPVTRAYSLMAGYGMSLWVFLQDLSQLKSTYRRKWESFTANAEVLQAFGNADLMTAKHISELIGKTTIFVRSDSRSSGSSSGGYSSNTSKRFSETSRPLVTPDEVRRFPSDKELLLVRGMNPIKADKIRYHEEKPFSKRAAENPMYIDAASQASASTQKKEFPQEKPPRSLQEILQAWKHTTGTNREARKNRDPNGAASSGTEDSNVEPPTP